MATDEFLRPPTRIRYAVLAWLCAAAAIVYVQRTAMGVIKSQMATDLVLSHEQLGWIMSAFYWAYALTQIPAGWLGSRKGSRFGLTLGVALTSVFCGLLSLANDFWTLTILWTGVGMSIAGIFPCCAQTFSRWFPETERALASGFLSSSQSIGATICTSLTGLLIAGSVAGAAATGWSPGLSWRQIFLLYSVPGLLWAISFAFWFRDRPEEHPGVNDGERALILAGRQSRVSSHGPTPWRAILTHWKMLLVFGQQFFRAAGYVFYATWFTTYLEKVFELPTSQAGYYNSLPFLGVVLGGVIGGPTSDFVLRRTGSRRLSRQLFGVTSQFVCAALFVAAWFAKSPQLAVGLMTCGSFVFAFGSCCSYTIVIDLAQPHVAPAFAAMNMAGNLGAAACPAVLGLLVDDIGWTNVPLFFAGIYVLSGLCWLPLNPNGDIYSD